MGRPGQETVFAIDSAGFSNISQVIEEWFYADNRTKNPPRW